MAAPLDIAGFSVLLLLALAILAPLLRSVRTLQIPLAFSLARSPRWLPSSPER